MIGGMSPWSSRSLAMCRDGPSAFPKCSQGIEQMPCLDLGRLGVSAEEKTRPENLSSPTDRSKPKHGQYEAGTKEECKPHPQRIAEKKKDHLQCQDTSIKGTQLQDGHDDFVTLDKKPFLQQCYTKKPYNMQFNEDVAAERRKQTVVEQVMVDQLCRIRTKSGLTENMLSNKLRFDSRIISRNGQDVCRELTGFSFACDKSLTVYEFQQFGKNRHMPCLSHQKGVYQHQRGLKKGKAYDLKSVKQNPMFILHLISIDEAAMDFLKLFPFLYSLCILSINGYISVCLFILYEDVTELSILWCKTLELSPLTFITLLTENPVQQAALKEALTVFHLEMPEGDFESLWFILDGSKSDKVNYGELTHAIFGEMNEYRKAFIRKAYMKLDFNKTGSKTAEEEIKPSFLEASGESCSNPNEMSCSEFEDYCEELSFGIVAADDFDNILRNSWGI
ncbi:hypothetical protein Nmel_005894 [Mimus melanotis]